jgi:hypothetical protein
MRTVHGAPKTGSEDNAKTLKSSEENFKRRSWRAMFGRPFDLLLPKPMVYWWKVIVAYIMYKWTGLYFQLRKRYLAID